MTRARLEAEAARRQLEQDRRAHKGEARIERPDLRGLVLRHDVHRIADALEQLVALLADGRPGAHDTNRHAPAGARPNPGEPEGAPAKRRTDRKDTNRSER